MMTMCGDDSSYNTYTNKLGKNNVDTLKERVVLPFLHF